MGCCSSNPSSDIQPVVLKHASAQGDEQEAMVKLDPDGEISSSIVEPPTRPGTVSTLGATSAFSLAMSTQLRNTNTPSVGIRAGSTTQPCTTKAGGLGVCQETDEALEIFHETNPNALNITPKGMEGTEAIADFGASSELLTGGMRPSTGDVHRLLRAHDFEDDEMSEGEHANEDDEDLGGGGGGLIPQHVDDDDEGDDQEEDTDCWQPGRGNALGNTLGSTLSGGLWNTLKDTGDQEGGVDLGLAVCGTTLKSEDLRRIEWEAKNADIRQKDENRPIAMFIPLEDKPKRKRKSRKKGPLKDLKGNKRKTNKITLVPVGAMPGQSAQPDQETKSQIQKDRAKRSAHKTVSKLLRRQLGSRDKAVRGDVSDNGKQAVRKLCHLVLAYAALDTKAPQASQFVVQA